MVRIDAVAGGNDKLELSTDLEVVEELLVQLIEVQDEAHRIVLHIRVPNQRSGLQPREHELSRDEEYLVVDRTKY